MANTAADLTAALAGRYRVERELGSGGMATVFLAHDLRHERVVAIKVLHPDLGAALGGDRFLAEIKTTARLQHPHILPLLDSGEAGGLLFYVMPFVDGETLRARLERERQLPIDDALRIAREVADALAYAHGHGVIHRDIKPENILLQGGHALVADFGIALAVQQAGGPRMTQTGLSLGTPQYMSPEQATGERTIDGRADIYALAAVTYEMLTGQPPFTGATMQAIVAKVISAEPERPTLVRKSIPLHVEAAVLRALNKLPADRFATATEFSAALGGSLTAQHEFATDSRARAGPAGRALLLGGVTVAVLGAACGWLLGRREAPARAPTGAFGLSVLLPDSLSLQPQLTSAEGTATLAISPDGSLLVFAVGHGASAHLVARTLTDFSMRALSGTEGAQAPFFSPRGDAVYFVSANSVKRITLADGRVTTLRAPTTGEFAGEAWGGTVMSDGTIIVSQRLATELVVLSSTGDSIRTVACRVTCAFPAAMPDGRRVLATNGKLVYTLDIVTGAMSPVTRRGASGDMLRLYGMMPRLDADGHLVYATFDGHIFAAPFDARAARVTGPPVAIAEGVRVENSRGAAQFALSASGTLAYAPGDVMGRGILVRADRSGRLDTLAAPPDNYANLEVSPDGRRLAAVVDEGESSNVEVIDVATGQVSLWLSGQPVQVVAWTPDGRHLAFARHDSAFVGDPDAGTPLVPLPAGTAVGPLVHPLADTGAYISLVHDSAAVVRNGRIVGTKISMNNTQMYTATADGRWIVGYDTRGDNGGAVMAYALDGSQRRLTIAPAGYSMAARGGGGSEIIVAEVGLGQAGGAGGTVQTFYSITYDPSKPEPFGSPKRLFAAALSDFPGRNYGAGMGGNLFVFKQHVATAPLREVRVLTAWHDRLSAPARREY
jgi:eukaryotic-like serine/threonine-protein kinase